MSDTSLFRERIQTLNTQRERRLAEKLHGRQTQMEEKRAIGSRFKSVADRMFRDVIDPRLSLVATEFGDAEYVPEPATSHGLLRLNRENRYLARVELHVGLALEGEDRLRLYCRPEVIPVLMDVPDEQQLIIAIDAVDDDEVARFLEEQVGRFLEVYLCMENVEGYQKLHRVVDPVCGMEISRIDAAEHARYEGRNYYFCVPACKQEFLQDPDRYRLKGG
jgi:YHS domain-containing protein